MKPTIIVEKVLIQNGKKTPLFAVATSKRNCFSICESLTYEAHLTAWTPSRELAELQAYYLAAPDDGVEQDALMPQIERLKKLFPI
jgi:hypothetical protein